MKRFTSAIALSLLPLSAAAQQAEWEKLPRMQLERQYAGPLKDTLIQRWRDPVDGMVCYVYLPITAPHSTATAPGYVQYGSNVIGSISCVTPVAAPAAAPAQAKRPPAPPRPTAPAAPATPDQPDPPAPKR